MEAYNQKVSSQLEESADDLWNKIQDKLMDWDKRIINMRNDFDVATIYKLIETKASKESVSGDFSNHEFKIKTLDKNIVAIATDFETFQQAINRMHNVVIELQEANKDVLVGKRNLNCLSCGVKDGLSQSIPQAQSTVPGKDGRLYRGSVMDGLEVASQAKTTTSRVGSAHPTRANRFSEMVKEASESF